METVWKFRLALDDRQVMEMPRGAQILCVQTLPPNPQRSDRQAPYLWARVDTDEPLETRRFRMAGTGHNLESSMEDDEALSCYIGTFQLDFSDDCHVQPILVFHVFEISKFRDV